MHEAVSERLTAPQVQQAQHHNRAASQRQCILYLKGRRMALHCNADLAYHSIDAAAGVWLPAALLSNN